VGKCERGLDARLRFHDLRHTFKINIRRSEVDVEIRESILGHAYQAKDVTTRYGRIDDHEVIKAIDKITFDHGKTEVLLAAQG
jgi:integrase